MARRIRAVRSGAAARMAAASTALFALSPSFGQGADPVNVDVGRCVDLESAEERFACYEEQVDAATKEDERKRPDAPAGPSAEAGRPAEARPVAEAGPAGEAVEILGRIGSMRERLPDAYLITLEDGQIWRQTNPKRYFLRVGDDVRIYPSSWGTDYRLTVVGRSGYIQVEKVR